MAAVSPPGPAPTSHTLPAPTGRGALGADSGKGVGAFIVLP